MNGKRATELNTLTNNPVPVNAPILGRNLYDVPIPPPLTGTVTLDMLEKLFSKPYDKKGTLENHHDKWGFDREHRHHGDEDKGGWSEDKHGGRENGGHRGGDKGGWGGHGR